MQKFIKAYIKSMRLYYAFITGIAGWLGLTVYEYTAASPYKEIKALPSIQKKTVILLLLFLGWGINQIINDYLGLPEDRINAPHRPMVTGELHPQKAILVSSLLLIAAAMITLFYLQPVALLPLMLGVLLNIAYEFAKGYGIWGNIVFGVMISMCTVYGFLASGPTTPSFPAAEGFSVLLLVMVMNGLMTFYTYFKDYSGDKAANKKTVVVNLGPENSRKVALASSFLPGVVFMVLYGFNLFEGKINNIFVTLALLTLFLFIWTGYLYYKNPTGKKTYYSLAANFRACTCGQAALIALYNTELALILFLISYIFVGFLFDLHSNRKA